MKREIKFRVWDKNKKLFIPEDVYAILNRTSFGAFGQMITDWEDYKEGEYFYDNAQELVLFTGLTDKNGVEIYEGDIIKVGDKMMEVIFENGCFYTPYTNEQGDKSRYRIGGWMRHSFEVIGNIFQHHHLLTPTP